jgi:alkylation response protein AidB-like acyl-CoA dehydrogenase
MDNAVWASVIEAARRIAPVIREHNQEAERERRLSPPVLAALHEAGLLRMCTPRSLGGLEVDPQLIRLRRIISKIEAGGRKGQVRTRTLVRT